MSVPLLALVFAAAAAAQPHSGYESSVRQWRSAYENSLRADDGWLTLAGLFWLKEGANSAGTAPGSDILLPPGSAPARAGEFDFRGNITLFRAAAGAGVMVNGHPATEAPLIADTDGVPSLVQIGGLTMMVIHRGKRYGIRVKNKQSPVRLHFTGLRWYPVKPQYRIAAEFHAYPQPRRIAIPNVLGDTEPLPSPGYAAFTVGGVRVRLFPVTEDGRLFFIFRDRTSGKATYGSGRFLDADMPVNGKVTLDFNEAYNPPCAFTPYATCPLPPASNRLSVAIEAGEKKYGDH
jgi:uncharacterized protein (DUF1684 family)